MLVRLLPEQISCRWDIIKEAIIRASPPYADVSHEAMNNILMSLLNGFLQCWISVGEDKRIDAIVTTCVEEDLHSKTKNMLVYSVCALRKTTGKSWTEGFEAVRKYALSKGCKAIVAITKEPKVVRIVEKLGGDVDWRYLRLPIDPTL